MGIRLLGSASRFAVRPTRIKVRADSMPLQTKEGMYSCTKWMDATLRAMTPHEAPAVPRSPARSSEPMRAVKAHCVIVQSRASPGGTARVRMNAR
ncbi:hypothetical protein BON30_20175 [Cystobacter ferrugineus]|uniref:Uncharacterized protein n=1 Tax=Cystobacter ferrugineus TaxID=83449 RepID=A0A1L9B8K7_9BACT|nr:hypothetical protein BON30_20175 [Cystobacter ferrugineus]